MDLCEQDADCSCELPGRTARADCLCGGLMFEQWDLSCGYLVCVCFLGKQMEM